MSFDFSVGDFIAALKLVGNVVASLQEVGGASSQFRELTRELFSLETALLRVKQLEFEDHQHAEYVALKQAASQCRHTIDEFWTKAARYQKHLLGQGKTSTAKKAWMKVQWSLFKADDLARFQSDIAAHTQSILVLLATLQLQQINLQAKSNSKEYTTLRDFMQDSFQQCQDRISQISCAIGGSIAQGERLLRRTALIFQTNLQIFQAVRSIHDMLVRVPQGIERQQPVYMIDALGKTSPFHLEFVRSADTLRAVLKSNFEKVPSGLRKIENGEYVLYNQATGRRIDLTKDWDMCFLPGQRIEMRMVFDWTTRKRGLCPSCQTRCPRIKGKRDIECNACGLVFARTLIHAEAPTSTAEKPTKTAVKHVISMWSELNGTESSPATRHTTAFDESDDVQHYRRVHIISRKRRKVWQNPALVCGTPAPESPRLDASTIVAPTSPMELESNMEDDSLRNLDDILDPTTFELILEMDDDFDDREFSRSIIMGYFQQMNSALEDIGSLTNDPHSSLQRISSLGHFMKGQAYTIGLRKLGDLAWEIQFVAGTSPGDPYGFDHIKSEEDQRAFARRNVQMFSELYDVAKTKMSAFYKCPIE
ncbi:unnamed protein product [Periconia digitata]|uniref:HPt domain-containing protein n=1 Tax=Periconia digitata TaxID=1303443 RepID=A0A9W4U0K5_9PLEO|nr:unnamed protein product [Periconia digitata]